MGAVRLGPGGAGESERTVLKEEIEVLKNRLYKDRINGTLLFRQLIAGRLPKEAVLLDLGCGRGNRKLNFRSDVNVKMLAGCDLSAAVKENPYLSYGIRGDAALLPFRDEAFHLILMDYVLEHLKDPSKCARETFRVLKPGGCVVVRTPNIFHYITFSALITPEWVHRLLANRMRGIRVSNAENVFRKYYRANQKTRFRRIFQDAGFSPEILMMVECEPSYMVFSRLFFWLGYAYERIVNRCEWLSGIRANIFAVLRKPSKWINQSALADRPRW